MTDRPTDSRILDVLAFTRLGAERSGHWPLAGMPRLTQGILAVDDAAQAEWVVRGEQLPVTGGVPEIWLHLQAQAGVILQCQRCLQAVKEVLNVDRRFRFVRTEAEAARLDEESEDDVLVIEPRLDLAELLEDELILGLPIVPMHEHCPEPLSAALGDDEPPADDAPHPFAALAALRKKSTKADG